MGMLHFDLECDGAGGLTLMEKSKLKNLSRELAALLNIVVDVDGETEQSLDYPNREWGEVWRDASARLRGFCNNGILFTGLLKSGEYRVKINPDPNYEVADDNGLLIIKRYPIVFLETGELIQKILYPQLPLNTLTEIKVPPGKYKIAYNNQTGANGNLSINLTPLRGDSIKNLNNLVNMFG